MRGADPDAKEADLIRAAIAGDPHAFAELYDRHVEIVIKRLSHLMGPRGGVDDLTQETFLRVMKALHRFRGESPFRHFVLRIATSVAFDEMRRASRSPWRLFAEPEQIDEAASQKQDAEAYADLAAVHRALRRLSPRLREVVVLFELEGESLAEIAVELGISIHTAGSRLRRGREKLRQILERSGYSDCAEPGAFLCLGERT